MRKRSACLVAIYAKNMGRACGTRDAPAPVRRGLGNRLPVIEGSDTALYAERLINKAQHGDFAEALNALSRKPREAPLAEAVLLAICDTAAAQVRPSAERMLVRRVRESGFMTLRTPSEQRTLREQISEHISQQLEESLAAGEHVTPKRLRNMALRAAREIVSENTSSYTQQQLSNSNPLVP